MKKERTNPVRNLLQRLVEIWTDPVEEPVTTDEVISVTSHMAYNTTRFVGGVRSGLVEWAERRDSQVRERMRYAHPSEELQEGYQKPPDLDQPEQPR